MLITINFFQRKATDVSRSSENGGLRHNSMAEQHAKSQQLALFLQSLFQSGCKVAKASTPKDKGVYTFIWGVC
jgi:hypothetical protein